MPLVTQSPPDDHLSETILRQFLEGNLSSGLNIPVERHLASCSQCRSHLNQIVEEGDAADTSLVSLTQAFIRNGVTSPVPELSPKPQQYPDFETIAAYVDDTLTQEQTKGFEALMRQIPRLAQEVAQLRALKNDLQSSPAPNRVSIVANVASNTVPPTVVQQRNASSPFAKRGQAWWRWPVRPLGLATAASLIVLLIAAKPWQHIPSSTAPLPRGTHGTPSQLTPTSLPLSDNGDTRGGNDDVQTRLLALTNPQSDSHALFHLVKIQPYKAKGHIAKGRWLLLGGFNPPQPLVRSQPLEFQRTDGVMFHLENQSKQTLYLVLLWLQGKHIDPLTHGKSPVIRLTPKGTPNSQVDTPYFGNIQDAKIKSFVSTRPVNPAYLNFDGTEKNGLPSTGTESPLDAAIRQTVDGLAPSKPATSMDYKTWATMTSEIHVR
ncbi:hypothetical protein IAD21_00186 [Abditibacteriota bacterium]|nr:hypothetical protein IAD21_00186 [Abditibacteriota bacterium]